MNSRNLITLLMLLTIPMMAVADDSIWTENFTQAKSTAATEKKDLLLDFTGSDWCGWCIRLDKEVFAQPEYVKAAPDMFVHVKLDFPRNKSKITPEVKAQNEKLAKTYPIRGFPTIYLIDATGKPYAKAGYMRGGPKPYLANLKKLQAKRIQRDAALAAAEKAKGMAKVEKLGEALDAVDQSLVPTFYKDVIEQIRTLDPKCQSKAAKKWTMLEKKMADQKRVGQLVRQTRNRNAKTDESLAMIDKELKAGFMNQAMTDQVLLLKTRLLVSEGRAKEALPITTDFAKREKSLDPKLHNSMLSIHAWALCQTGKKGEGVVLLDTIIERTKGDDAKSMALATKARIMQEIGDTALAIEAYEQALKIAKNKHLKNRYTKTLEALKKTKDQK
jgi:thioredoxin-related protein